MIEQLLSEAVLWVILAFIAAAFATGLGWKYQEHYFSSPFFEDQQNFDEEQYRNFRKKIYGSISVVIGIIGIFIIYQKNNTFFGGLFRSVFFFFFLYWLGYRLSSLASYLRKKPVTVEKAQTANGLGTLGDKIKASNGMGTSGAPLVTYYQDEEFFYSLTATNEDRAIVVGVPGSGKTSLLVTQAVDWMHSGKTYVITDIKPEIWGILKTNGAFDHFGYTDWVINPTDVMAHHYNMFSEAYDSAEMNEILNILMVSNGGDGEVFIKHARRLLKAILMHLGKDASLPAAQLFINSTSGLDELLRKLKKSHSEEVINIAQEISNTANNTSLMASIMTALSDAFAFLDDARIKASVANNADGLRFKEILKKPKQAIFLQFDQQYTATTAPLFGAMVAHILRILQSNHQDREDVFLMLDEITNCAPIPRFSEWLNTIRSAKMPCWLYFQSTEGLVRKYGVGADRLFLGSSNLKISFKLGDIHTAKEFSELIGKTDVTRYSYSQNESNSTSKNASYQYTSNTSNSSGYTASTNLESIIGPEDFIRMPAHAAVVMYNGGYGTLTMPKYWEYFEMPMRANDCVRRPCDLPITDVEEKQTA